MKLVALLLMKNEAWILPAFLSSVAGVVDEIVAVDDSSTDDSRKLVEAAGGHVIAARTNARDGIEHWDFLRHDMLDAGRERGGTHFLCLDADEALTAPGREHLRRNMEKLEPGQKLMMQWLALWKDPTCYRDDESVWSNSFKDFAVADAPGLTWEGTWPHRGVGRTPGTNADMLVRAEPDEGAVLHFQFAAWQMFQGKQAWYRCAELLQGRPPFDINIMYAPTVDDPDARTTKMPDSWLEGIDIPAGITELPPAWHLDAIYEFFDEHGIETFEPLQIWQVPQLRERFVREVGREPVPLTKLSIPKRALRVARLKLEARRAARA